MRDELGRRATAQVPFLIAQVGSRAAATDMAATTLAAIRDHWWVQRQSGTQWVDLDPLLPTAQVGAAPAAPERTFV